MSLYVEFRGERYKVRYTYNTPRGRIHACDTDKLHGEWGDEIFASEAKVVDLSPEEIAFKEK